MMMVIPTLFGLEGIVADELRWKGFQGVVAENGRVFFDGDFHDVAKANIQVRCGERVQIVLNRFRAESFEALFQGVKAIDWKEFIGRDNAFPVKGWSLNSKLHSVPDCQKIVKKAIVEKLKEAYGQSWFEETGSLVQVQFSILKDEALIVLDTSGQGLHKRGYRQNSNMAPIRETLAAGIVELARVHPDSIVCDPFCGSGTFAIESAMKAMNIAPGLLRRFACEQWDSFPNHIFAQQRELARDQIKKDADFQAFAYDVDEHCVSLTKENAKKARVASKIRVERRDVRHYAMGTEKAVVLCNPPYGERMFERKEAETLYGVMGVVFAPKPRHSYYIITPHDNFEVLFGRKADKKRKLYNGMIKCDLYMYFR